MFTFEALGAAQDVGRSCFVLKIDDKTIMLDCGIHILYTDKRRYPDILEYVKKENQIRKTNKTITETFDFVLVSHFHLDHSGAIPYLTNVCGYEGPIYMSAPTKKIVPILFTDYLKLRQKTEQNKKISENSFETVTKCMKNVFTHDLGVFDISGVKITAYYAGHVLGAVMYHIQYNGNSVVYTGDYNTIADRHLGAASLPRLCPDLMITETTYATTTREGSKKKREREFLRHIHDGISTGGKILIPVMALGRAQELCLLIEMYWERMGLTKVPIYATSGMREKATELYGEYIQWTNNDLKNRKEENTFDYKFIRIFKMNYLEQEGPMVIFSTPEMISRGTSLEIFKRIASNEKNVVIIPGYCVKGTIGDDLLKGKKLIKCGEEIIKSNIQVKNLSFALHADSKGILQLIRQTRPRNIVFVHGDKNKMIVFKKRVVQETNIPCFIPSINEILSFDRIEEQIVSSFKEKNFEKVCNDLHFLWRWDRTLFSKQMLKLVQEKEEDFFKVLNRLEDWKIPIRRDFIDKSVEGLFVEQTASDVFVEKKEKFTLSRSFKTKKEKKDIFPLLFKFFYPKAFVKEISETSFQISASVYIQICFDNENLNVTIKWQEYDEWLVSDLLYFFEETQPAPCCCLVAESFE